jgi:hypothetical protein
MAEAVSFAVLHLPLSNRSLWITDLGGALPFFCDARHGQWRAALHQLSINLPPDLFEFVQRTAERKTRPAALQIRHFIAEAARRAGHRSDDGPSIGVPLPTDPEPLRAELGELEAELDRLDVKQRKLTWRFGPDDETRLRYVRSRLDAIRPHVRLANLTNGGDGHAG